MFWSFRQISIIAIIVLALVGGTTCNTSKRKTRGEKAVEEIHTLFNSGQYKEIYQRADESYKML